MTEFTDKVALITGAGQGVGREVAQVFASLGTIVAVNDINPLIVDDTVDSIIKAGGKARSYVFDVAKRMPVEGLVTQVLEHFGRVDYLINHAKVMPDASMLAMDEWDFHRALDVNLGGPFFTMQLVGRVMRQQGGGAMVNIISDAPAGGFRNGHSAFTATQFGLVGLTQAAAAELLGFNIRVNAVHLGQAEILQNSSSSWDGELYNRWISSAHMVLPVNRPGLVGRIIFLCSQAAASMSGLVIVQ